MQKNTRIITMNNICVSTMHNEGYLWIRTEDQSTDLAVVQTTTQWKKKGVDGTSALGNSFNPPFLAKSPAILRFKDPISTVSILTMHVTVIASQTERKTSRDDILNWSTDELPHSPSILWILRVLVRDDINILIGQIIGTAYLEVWSNQGRSVKIGYWIPIGLRWTTFHYELILNCPIDTTLPIQSIEKCLIYRFSSSHLQTDLTDIKKNTESVSRYSGKMNNNLKANNAYIICWLKVEKNTRSSQKQSPVLVSGL